MAEQDVIAACRCALLRGVALLAVRNAPGFRGDGFERSRRSHTLELHARTQTRRFCTQTTTPVFGSTKPFWTHRTQNTQTAGVYPGARPLAARSGSANAFLPTVPRTLATLVVYLENAKPFKQGGLPKGTASPAR